MAVMAALHLVLVEPEIHWNTGNVGRTALALGATLHLVEPLGFALGDKEVRRAGLDYWEHVALVRHAVDGFAYHRTGADDHDTVGIFARLARTHRERDTALHHLPIGYGVHAPA